jgi:hypothetical protein
MQANPSYFVSLSRKYKKSKTVVNFLGIHFIFGLLYFSSVRCYHHQSNTRFPEPYIFWPPGEKPGSLLISCPEDVEVYTSQRSYTFLI